MRLQQRHGLSIVALGLAALFTAAEERHVQAAQSAPPATVEAAHAALVPGYKGAGSCRECHTRASGGVRRVEPLPVAGQVRFDE